MVGLRQATAFHHDVDEYGRPISAQEREKFLRPYLPDPPLDSSTSHNQNRAQKRAHGKPVRQFIRLSLYALIFNIIHFAFSIYIRLRRAYRSFIGRVLSVLYYHHRTPELIQRDVKNLPKVPHHLSIILELPENGSNGAALETLVQDVCECAAWSACAGIPTLSIYERTGDCHTRNLTCLL